MIICDAVASFGWSCRDPGITSCVNWKIQCLWWWRNSTMWNFSWNPSSLGISWQFFISLAFWQMVRLPSSLESCSRHSITSVLFINVNFHLWYRFYGECSCFSWLSVIKLEFGSMFKIEENKGWKYLRISVEDNIKCNP